MALYPAAPITFLNHAASDKGRNRGRRAVMMCANTNDVSLNLKIRSYHKCCKVFEDRSTGIVCYKDENGEIVCEGYDEGPRFHQQISRFTHKSSRDAELIELLQRCWVHVAAEDEFKNADKEGVEEDINSCNGSNNLC